LGEPVYMKESLMKAPDVFVFGRSRRPQARARAAKAKAKAQFGVWV
jgi:hypothetical protein